jgi:hypothetical protein
MALWISHLVLLMNELMGRSTSSGIPTEINASILLISLVYDWPTKLTLAVHAHEWQKCVGLKYH